MNESINRIKRLLDACTDEERASVLDYLKERHPEHPLEAEWGVSADVILSAISRSNDLTKRGIRGIIAEAIFERHTLSRLVGWSAVPLLEDRPYDFLIRLKKRELRIQVKLQRRKKQRVMMASEANPNYPNDMYVVKVQKTRGGIDPTTGEDTRPYRYSDFDILAVNLHPSTNNWKEFRYTVSNWLLPRYENLALIEKFQPVAREPNESWTDSLGDCIEWLTSGDNKRVLDISPEHLQLRKRKLSRKR